MDPWLPLRLEAELRLAQGRVAEAAAVIDRGLADPNLRRSERFTWPLLVIGAQVAAAGVPGLLDELRCRAARSPDTGPVLHALALTFAAETGRAAATAVRARCDEAVAAWEEVGNPYRLARALVVAAEAAAAGGDRPAAAAQVRRAAEIAGRLGARPLQEQAEWLARRARLTLAGDPAAPAADAGEPPRESFVPVTVSNGVSLDYVDAVGFGSHHCAFLVSEAEFEAAFARIRSAGIPYYAGPRHQRPGEVSLLRGGRGVWFDDPDGHTIEITTQPAATA